MDLYTFSKLVHVMAAIAWVGGGVALIAQASFGSRTDGPRELLRTIRGMGSMSARWFMPSGLLTLISGLLAAYLGNMWSQAWIVIGLAGFIVTSLTGHFVLRVKGERVSRLMGEGREQEAIGEARSMMRVSKFDYTVVTMVVVVMVVKPQWQDVGVLGAVAVITALAGLSLLLPPLRSRAAA